MNTARTVILLAHGARNPAWAQPFERVAEQLRAAQPGLLVHLAFLELMGPSLPEVLAQVAAAGRQQVDVLPLFLSGSGHVLRDVPPLLDAARAEHGLSIRLHSAIGQQAAMVAAMAQVCAQLLEEPPMNLQQFRYVAEAARRGLNLTETAKALHTSQPGVSKAILELEEELGVDIFSRHGKRLRRITEPGQQVLKSTDLILREVSNLKRLGEEFSRQDSGQLSIATTHTQARYVLPGPLAQLRKQFPKLQISLHQGNPKQVAQMVPEETSVIGVATESLDEFDELVSLPWYEWQHVAVMPRDHPLAEAGTLSLELLAAHPLISYQSAFTGRTRIDRAFQARNLNPQVVLEAIDADVIKTYVRAGFGVGLVAEMAMRDETSGDLVWRPVGHLFGQNVARVAFKRGVYLRNHVLTFAGLLSDRLSTPLLQRALGGSTSSYEL